jgi:hypothetical protein
MSDKKEAMQADGLDADEAENKNRPTAGRPDMDANAGQSGGGAYPNPYNKQGENPEEDRSFHGGQSIQGYFGDAQLGDKEEGENVNAGSEED